MPLYTVELHTSTVTTLESNYSIETEHCRWRCLERNIRNDLKGRVVEVDGVGLLQFVPCFLTGQIFMQDDGRTSCIPSPPHHHHRRRPCRRRRRLPCLRRSVLYVGSRLTTLRGVAQHGSLNGFQTSVLQRHMSVPALVPSALGTSPSDVPVRFFIFGVFDLMVARD